MLSGCENPERFLQRLGLRLPKALSSELVPNTISHHLVGLFLCFFNGDKMIGYLKLHRKIKKWEWYKESHMVHLFIHLLIDAYWEDTKFRGICYKRGQLTVGRKQLSADTGISEQKIRTGLKRIEVSGEISVKSTSKFSIITICNYEEYQGCDGAEQPAINQQVTSNQPAINQQLTTVKEVKKIKEVKEVKNTYGTFKNVLLTEKQYDELKLKFNGTCEDKIETLSLGIESKGYKYKNHYATILAWDRKDKKDNNGGQHGNSTGNKKRAGYIEAGKKDYRS